MQNADSTNMLRVKEIIRHYGRSPMYNGQEPQYGTQAKGIQVTDRETGGKIFKMIVWPVKNEKEVNATRKGQDLIKLLKRMPKGLALIMLYIL